MHRMLRYGFTLLTGAALAFAGAHAPAADTPKKDRQPAVIEQTPLPEPAQIKSLDVHPKTVALKGVDSAQQLIVTATLLDGRQQDLSGDAKYDVADAKVARVTTSGRVLPLGDGGTQITVVFGDKSVKVPVTTASMTENLPINFGNQIVPIFTKLGCNSGGCHGKLSGQNGFRLSLLGFEPELDFATLTRENRGRRVNPSAPDASLLLQKISGTVAHGGGKRMETNSDEYKLIRRWIAAGTPFGSDTDPTITKLEVFPPHRFLTRNNRQQFAVYAHYSDGSVEDVTRRAQYESNDQEIAIVDATGLVRTLDQSGEGAIMARYLGQVTTIRATIPLGVKIPDYKFTERNVVDRHTHEKWKQLGIVPSEQATDEQFIRRASIDLTGTLPEPKKVLAFVADNDPKKYDKLIDELVDSPEFAYYFANKWADILRVKRGQNQQGRAYGTFAFHAWIREALAADKPYDEFARDILTAVGDESQSPPTVWYKDIQTADQFVDNVSQVFLGTRMQCAQCHHHPYERYSQDDYWGLAAYFGRVNRKNITTPGQQNQGQNQRQFIYTRPTGNVVNKRTNKPAVMKPLDGDPVTADREEDPRNKLADWLTDAKNPFFARAVANRYWAHFFGKGIVDPLDDMRVTNPPSNPELLDALAKELVDHKYSLKHLVKVIAKSQTYRLSSTPNEFNKHDRQSFARYYPKRMTAEVIFDAVSQVTNSPTPFPGLPSDAHAPRRAIMLPDESFASYFLDVFGRPQRISACECERVAEANLAQVLHLLNSEEVQQKLSRDGARADQMAKDARPDSEKVEELFLWALGTKPSPEKLDKALSVLRADNKDKKRGYEDIIWALINTKAFTFNQ
jgi:hypothetical protein